MAAVLVCALSTAGARASEFKDFGDGSPAYRAFIPTHPIEPVAPLIVILHGCEEDADVVARMSRFNDLAEANGIYLLYPNQQRNVNVLNCWNFFLPSNERPNSGDPATIKQYLDRMKAAYPIDAKRVYLVGYSSGGGEAPVLLSCFPNDFAAGAILSGLPYGIATSIGGALMLMASGPRPPDEPRGEQTCDPANFHGGLIIFQGSADTVVNPANAPRIIADFLPPGAQRVPPRVYPPEDGKLGYEVTDWTIGGKVKVREVLVSGMEHAWSGGLPNVPFSDPRGPSATRMMWSFFSDFSKP